MMNPLTFLRVLGPEPWNVAYVEPSVRPDDSRYGDNPNRLQRHTQFQVILKPDPGNSPDLPAQPFSVRRRDLASSIKKAKPVKAKTSGGVTDLYVEYHGEEDSEDGNSCSDFEDEIVQLSDDQPDVMTAEPHSVANYEGVEHILFPDDTGVITQVIASLVKHTSAKRHTMHVDSQQIPMHVDSQHIHEHMMPAPTADSGDSEDSEDSDPEYMPHSEDSGEDSEVVKLRKHARKKMRHTKSWIGIDTTDAVPFNLIANMKEQQEERKRTGTMIHQMRNDY
ncbi:hypothetical protein ZWY2020_032058 [Hordeum vulgare]|nr:hypothetical protein ZWY2020_032058 [Hordeum vulgare]